MLLKDYIYQKNHSDTKSNLNSVDDNLIKIIYIPSGDGTVLLNGEIYPINNKSFYIIDAKTLHFVLKKSKDFVVNALFIDREHLLKIMQTVNISPSDFENHAFALDDIGVYKIKDIFSHIALFEKPTDILVAEKMLNIFKITQEHTTPLSVKESATGKILKYIDENLQKRLDLDIISESLHTSVWYLCHTFKETTGFTIKEYIRILRIQKAKEMLAQSEHSISTISEMCGFDSFSFFSRAFSKETGETPSAYRKSHSTVDKFSPKRQNRTKGITGEPEKYYFSYTNPILPVFEYSTVDLRRIFFDIAPHLSQSSDNYKWHSNEPNVIFDNSKHLLTAGKNGIYTAECTYKDISQTVIICVLSHRISTPEKYEATIFEYDFENKTEQEILKDWVFQTRRDNVGTFLPPSEPKTSLTRQKDGFIPFPAAYKNSEGKTVHNCFCDPKDPTNVGFMYLKAGNLPELLNNYRIYVSGTLTALAKSNNSSESGSTAAKAGIVGRIVLNNEKVIDNNSCYQATLVSVSDHPLYKLCGKNAHQNIFLTENTFFEFGYDSETPKFFGTNVNGIKIGDKYTLFAEFLERSITTGIKKGTMDQTSAFALRQITDNCTQTTTGVNYMRGNKIHAYSAISANLCSYQKGTVGFAFMGAETAISKFRVTHLVDTVNIPTISYLSREKIIKLVKDRTKQPANISQKSACIPTRQLQKQLNCRTNFLNPEGIPENRLAKFCILTNTHIFYKNYYSDFENNAFFKQNFLKYINSSDSEFLVSCGDNLSDGNNYTYASCSNAYKNLCAFYDLMSYLPDKDYFVLKGNRDASISDFADNFILKEKNITVIGFCGSYIGYPSEKNGIVQSSGRLTEKTVEWIKNACFKAVSDDPETHIIFLCHYSLDNSVGGAGFAEDGYQGLADIRCESVLRNELLDIITAFGVELYISGHEDRNDMKFCPVKYRSGFDTGCINYSVGNTPVDCTITKNENGETSVLMEQYFYGDFSKASRSIGKNRLKSVEFKLNHKVSQDRLSSATKFLKARDLLNRIFSTRYDGLYKYTFGYCGIIDIEGSPYYKFDVSFLKYHIVDNTTVYADADEEIDSSIITSHLKNIYISEDSLRVYESTDDGDTEFRQTDISKL